ncbi:MAG: methyltransferase domain-containing protein [Actinomycetota bacterium]|nr:methyltransferase domain-containing protein [Actinomycetota bacterium]
MDLPEVKQRIRGVWSQGDYSTLSRMLEPAAIELCEACGVSAGQEVLDVAAGDGNFALASARRGARVTASDLSPRMVERGRARSAADGLDIDWVEADAEELPFEEGRFHCVGSAFGAMIAPRPRVAAEELFRVARPGGTVGMTAWVPGSFTAELIGIGRRYTSPPDWVPPSDEWGMEDRVHARFEGLATSVTCRRGGLVHEAESAEALAESLAQTAPPMVAARQFLSIDRFEALVADNLELVRRWNEAEDGSLRIRSEYLLVVAHKGA